MPRAQYMTEKGIVEACPGLGGDCFIIARINERTGGRHKIKTLPTFLSQEDADTFLAAYANKKGWEKINEEG